MATEARSGTSDRFTLDTPSFEKFLAAAWVLQCQRDQELLSLQIGVDEASTLPASIQKTAQAADLHVAIKAEVRSFTDVVYARGSIEMPRPEPQIRPVHSEIKLDALTRDRKLGDAILLHPVEGATESESPDGARPEANRKVATPNPSFDLAIAFRKLHGVLTRARPSFRVRLPAGVFGGARTMALVVVLATLSGWLLLGISHHQAAQRMPAIAQSSAAHANIEVSPSSPPPAITNRNVPQKIAGTVTSASAAPPMTSFQTSHLKVTDAATLSFVHDLSSYEIRGLRRRARYGDPSAAFELGMAYETGRHLHQSCVEAARWVAKAAQAGSAAAQYNLGLRYQSGDGVRANSALSRKWLRKASRRNPNAKLALKLLASR